MLDITQSLVTCRVFPGDTAPRLTRVCQMPQDNYNLTDMTFCVHNGTHIDAPRHFIADGAGVGALPLDLFYGPCTVADATDHIAPLLAHCAERLLLRGDGKVTPETATLIARSHVKLLGIEGQSVGGESAPMAVHQLLLGAGIVLLEGLVLEKVPSGNYILSAFPLNLGPDCDGSPVRAVLLDNIDGRIIT